MKLFVTDNDGVKHYLSALASSRKELADQLGNEFIVDDSIYNVQQVNAESDREAAPVSAVIGSAIGLVGGMPGVLIGGAIGALLGNESDKKENANIEAFNRS